MRSFITIFFIMIYLSGRCQVGQEYSLTFDNTSLSDAILEIESRSEYKFFYSEEWLNDLTVSTTLDLRDINEATLALLKDTNLYFAILDQKVILTNNTPIETELQKETSVNELQYLFEREYQGDSDEVMIIGDKSKMVIGGESFLGGFVTDVDTGDPITGAIVFIEEPERSAVTDIDGLFSIRLPNGNNQLRISFAGMKAEKKDIILFSDGNLNIELQEEDIVLDELTIIADQDVNISTVKMGLSSLKMEDLKNIPKVLGENDLVQVVLSLPGVQSVGEGTAGINVRGGKADQNLIRFNSATVYNPFHFFGFFSSFNADIMGDVQLYKSSIPANFGGRLSALLDVKMKAGNKEKLSGKGGINPVTSQLSLEVPLVKGSTSLTTGIRTTYSDWVLNRVDNKNIRQSDPSFFDIATGIHHEYGDNNSIVTSIYYSKDSFRITPDSMYSYFNFTTSLEWTHFLNTQLSVNAVASTSSYSFDIDYEEVPESAFNYGFDISDIFGQVSLNYFPNDQHEVKVGADVKLYDVLPGIQKPIGEFSEVPMLEIEREKGRESSIYIADNFSITPQVTLYGGLRYSFFQALGGRSINFYEKDLPRNETTVSETIGFAGNEVISSFHGPELRLSARYGLSPSSSIKISYSKTRQYIHSISNNISASPTDIWKLSDPNFAPQLSDQFAFGYYRNFLDNSVEVSVETYYKTFDNLLDYKVGADLVLNPSFETGVIQGQGRAYGLEFLMKKKSGKFNGWLAYTYSRSQQRFRSNFTEETINGGSYYPTNHEKPHDINIVTNYRHTRRYSFSLNINYSTGRPITYPTAKYRLANTNVVHFSERNQFRIPDYFRIDVSVNIEGSHKIKKLAHSYWSFSVYNLTGRQNVYSVFFANEDGRIRGYELSVLGRAIPSITYNFKF